MGKPMYLGQVTCFSRAYQVATAGFALDTIINLRSARERTTATWGPHGVGHGGFCRWVSYFFLTRGPPDSAVEP